MITDVSNIGGKVKLEPNGSGAVTLQDQTTPTVIVKFSQLEQSTTINVLAVLGAYTISVADATGIATGKLITLFDPDSVRFSQFVCVSVAAPIVNLDSPLDFAFPSGSFVDVSETDMAVDGSGAAVVFGVRNNAGSPPPPGVALSVDITRVIIKCFTTTAPTLALFGNIAKLTRGLMLRKRDGRYQNIFNVKDNGEIAGIMYDFTIQTVAGVGQDGFYSRLTFGGQSKMGVVQRLAINEDLEILVQDDLQALTLLEIEAEGSLVQP